MTQGQRYVSKELTHFVGRGPTGPIPLEEQYGRLLSILTRRTRGSLWLTSDPANPGVRRKIDIHPARNICDDDAAFDQHPVCFCDIPVEDLGIHMGKYGYVGLSFLKTFLVPKGASPVFYVAKDSLVELDFRDEEPRLRSTREGEFNAQVSAYLSLFLQRLKWVDDKRGFPKEECGELLRHVNDLSHPTWHLYYYVFGFVKAFDTTLQETHDKNYYMEREWRMVMDLGFELADVWRVILPRELVGRFRRDVPAYEGQITFAEPVP